VGLRNEEARVTLGIEEICCGEFGPMFRGRGEGIVHAWRWLDEVVVCATSRRHTKMGSVEMEINAY
jgi:hypothetical protein